MDKRILIFDERRANRERLEDLLCADYETAVATNSQVGLRALPAFSPDLVLLHVGLPETDGYEICHQIRSGPLGNFTQIILLGRGTSVADRLRGFDAGADDFIVEPFDPHEFLAKIRVRFRFRDNVSDLWMANARIREFNSELEYTLERRATEVVATRDVAVFALANLAESRDPETKEHLHRMRNYSRVLAEELQRRGPYTDRIDDQFVEDVFRSSPLHDIGKVGIPDAVLLKPSRLTLAEFEVMKRHTIIGADALEQAIAQNPCGGFLHMAIDVARYHHERVDGNGYPDGLSAEAIPLAARIVALADVYDALTSARVYKPAYDPAEAKRIIEQAAGKQFDPAVVEAFSARYEDSFLVGANLQQAEPV